MVQGYDFRLDYDLDDDPVMREMDDYESGQVVADWLAQRLR